MTHCHRTFPGAPIVAIAATALNAVGTGASAQESPDSGQSTLEEIIVTAQKRVENLQEVPISVHVIDGAAIAERNHTSLVDLTQVVPAVHVNTNGATTDVYIRGIGSGGNASFDQSVGLFIDDIFHGRSRTALATFLDLERIEVLKGPQSTYFGNNAIGGALNVSTNKPGKSAEAFVRALYGEDGQYALEAAFGGPLSDTFGARFAATTSGLEGWMDNVNTGKQGPRAETYAGRVSLAWNPSEDLEVAFKVEGSQDVVKGSGFGRQPMQVVNCPPPAPIPAGAFGDTCSNTLALNLPRDIDKDLYASLDGEGNQLSNFETVLTVNYSLGDTTFSSISGFYNYHYNLDFDGRGTPVLSLTTEAPEKYRQFSQELRIVSAPGRVIEYVAGAYFQKDELNFALRNGYFFLTPLISGNPSLAPLVPYLPLGRNIQFAQDEKSYALFGSLTWNATDRLKLTAGLRATKVEKDFEKQLHYGTATHTYGGIVQLPAAVESPAGYFGQGVPGTVSGDRSDDAWTPSARVQYALTPSAMVYASYARGFKAGGFNGVEGTSALENHLFDPEYVDAYEVGLKSELFDGQALLNLAVFRSDYSDLQVSSAVIFSDGTGAFLVNNAASSRAQGVELESIWAPTHDFRIAANVTYLDSYYVSYPGAGPTFLQILAGQSSQDLSGRPTQFAPEWSGGLSLRYGHSIAGRYRLTGEVNPYFTTEYFLSGNGADDPFLQQGDYVRVDAQLSLEAEGGRWAVDLIGKNLTDRVILTAFGNLYLASKQQPRNFALQFRYRW